MMAFVVQDDDAALVFLAFSNDTSLEHSNNQVSVAL
jgi:hypothetical protein